MQDDDNRPIDIEDDADIDDIDPVLTKLDEDNIRQIVLEALAEFHSKPYTHGDLIQSRNDRAARHLPLPNASESSRVVPSGTQFLDGRVLEQKTPPNTPRTAQPQPIRQILPRGTASAHALSGAFVPPPTPYTTDVTMEEGKGA